jgi:hypothetical protein
MQSTIKGWPNGWRAWCALNANELTWTALVIGVSCSPRCPWIDDLGGAAGLPGPADTLLHRELGICYIQPNSPESA